MLESFPEQHVLNYTFTSSHGGYGNRTDQIVTEALTPHSIEIIVSEGKVTSAVIDGEWDEINQEPLEAEADTTDNTTGTSGAGENTVEMKYLISEEKAPWEQWYEEGNIQFIKAPTPSELITAYYGTVYGIEVSDIRRIESCDLGYLCGGEYYVGRIKDSDSTKMKELGWTYIGEY